MKHLLFNFTIMVLLVLSVCCNTRQSQDDNKEPTVKMDKKDYVTFHDSTGLLMDEDSFWSIIEKSKAASGNNYTKQIKSLENVLLGLEEFEIEKFNKTFTAIMAGYYDWKLWGASYVINGGCSDDCFEYFRQYLIAHGKEKFYSTLKEPESCAGWIKSEDEENWEGIQYSAFHAY